MAKRIGEVQEVQITLPNGFVGEFIRIHINLDVNKKLTRFVSFTRKGETEFYQVKFEKLPTFCYACGKLGHWHEECGSGEHDEKKFEWGPFILASRRGRGGSRGSGPSRDGGAGRGDMNGRGTRGRAGRGMNGRSGTAAWRWNYDPTKNPEDPNGMEYDYSEKDGAATSENNSALVVRPEENLTSLGKRQAADSTNLGSSSNGNVGVVANIVDRFEPHKSVVGAVSTVAVTPQKNKNRKKHRTGDDEISENTSDMDDETDANQMISAASDLEAVWT